MRDIADQLVATADPFGMGMGSLDHFDLGYQLTLGQTFPHHEGGYLLQRRALYPTPGEWRFCGFARRENDLLLPDPPGIGFYFPFPDPRPLINDDQNLHTISPEVWLLLDPPGIGFYFPFPEPGRSDAAWQYRACKVLGNGFISENFTEPVRVDFGWV